MRPDDRQKVNFLKRRQTAYQAWYEHMPVPPQAAPRFDSLRIYGNHGFGQLLDIALLDTRQYRADPVNGVSDGPQPTMLGAEQESWLDQTLKQSRAKWTVIGQQTLLSERDTVAGPETGYNLDGWDGYRAARTGLLDSVRAAKITNPIIIGGDLHAFYAADVKTDFRRRKQRRHRHRIRRRLDHLGRSQRGQHGDGPGGKSASQIRIDPEPMATP